MKFKLILLLSILFLIQISCSKEDESINVINVEKIYNGNIWISTQTQLDNFGANKYDRINGTLTLSGSDVVNANSLSSVKFIYGDLLLNGTNIENMDGFQNVNLKDDSYVIIQGNNKLKNLNELQNITAELRILDILLNPLLEDIDGLKNITNVTGRINISENDKLKNLNGLSSVTNTMLLFITQNLELIDTNGLSNIKKVSDHIDFSNNDLVYSLNLNSLDEVPGMIISHNEGLNNINLGNLKTTFLDLKFNNNLLNIDFLSSLETCSSIHITDNSSLENLNGLANLKQVDYHIVIARNKSLKNLCGLALLASLSPNEIIIGNNNYNPTKDDINNGNCSN